MGDGRIGCGSKDWRCRRGSGRKGAGRWWWYGEGRLEVVSVVAC